MQCAYNPPYIVQHTLLFHIHYLKIMLKLICPITHCVKISLQLDMLFLLYIIFQICRRIYLPPCIVTEPCLSCLVTLTSTLSFVQILIKVWQYCAGFSVKNSKDGEREHLTKGPVDQSLVERSTTPPFPPFFV